MLKKLTICILAAMVFFVAGEAFPQEYWPMFNRDLLNTGVADPTLVGPLTPQEKWSYSTDNAIGSGSPVIGDIDDDGDPDVLIPTCNFSNTGGIYALEKDGTLKWKYQTGDYGTYATPPLADIDGDGKLETIFPSYGGKIIAVDDDGTQMWIVDKGSAGTRSVIADLTTEEGLEVVAGAAGATFLLKTSDGSQIWQANYTILCDPAIADVDGDGKPEILFSTNTGGNFVVALNAEDGSVAWTSTAMGQFAQNNIAIISDINADSKPDVVVGARDSKLYVFSGADGTKLWEYTVVGRCFSAAVADFNSDGYDDVVTTACTGTPESYAYLIDVKNQTLLWQHDIIGKASYTTERSPSIADVNADGQLDVLIAGLSKKLYALSGTDGSEIWTIDTNDPSAGVPAIGDLDGNGVMDIIVSAGSSVQMFSHDQPIPVELTTFTATVADDVVILEWKTQTETENYGYHVYRSLSADGEYAKITNQIIRGAGSSAEAHTYIYTDRDVQNGMTYYYKLCDVDYNGNKHFHGPSSVTVGATIVTRIGEGIPTTYSLAQNYPNPFNPETAINFSIKQAGKVSLKIYNLQGQLIRSLVDEDKLAGSYSIIWNGTNDQGIRVSSGTYLYTLKVNGFEDTKKLVFMK